MANSVDPDQTAPIGAVCSGPTLFALTLNSSVMLVNYFLGALRAKPTTCRQFDCSYRTVYLADHLISY